MNLNAFHLFNCTYLLAFIVYVDIAITNNTLLFARSMKINQWTLETGKQTYCIVSNHCQHSPLELHKVLLSGNMYTYETTIVLHLLVAWFFVHTALNKLSQPSISEWPGLLSRVSLERFGISPVHMSTFSKPIQAKPNKCAHVNKALVWIFRPEKMSYNIFLSHTAQVCHTNHLNITCAMLHALWLSSYATHKMFYHLITRCYIR